jgi:Uma2 family endonuclease
MLSPDAAYLTPAKLKGLTKADINRGFVHRCPDFVIELLSRSDSPSEAHAKMGLWLENGAALGWLGNPYKRTVHIYQPGVKGTSFTGKLLRGVGPVEGFTLDLEEVWRCYEV